MEAGEGGFQPVVGVVSAPALGRRWWAAKGARRVHRPQPGLGEPAAASRRSAALEDASFAYSSLSGWEEQGRLDGFLDLTRACWRTRGYGDFWPYMMVAEGSVDICAEPELSLWDMAAIAIVVAGGGRHVHRPGRAARSAQRQRGGVERSAPRRAAGLPEPAQTDRRRPLTLRRPRRIGSVSAPAPPGRLARPLVGPLRRCHSESPPTCELVNSFSSTGAERFTKEVAPPMLVRDAMSTVVLTIGPAHTLRQAARLMSARRVGAAVVLDPDTADSASSPSATSSTRSARGQNPDHETAGAHTTTDVVFAAPTWTLEEAAEAMTHGGFRHLIVLDDRRSGRRRLGARHHPLLGPGCTASPAELDGDPVRARTRRERAGRPDGNPARSVLLRQASGQPRRAWTAASSRLPKSPSAWRKLSIARSAMSSRETLAMKPAMLSIRRLFSSSDIRR